MTMLSSAARGSRRCMLSAAATCGSRTPFISNQVRCLSSVITLSDEAAVHKFTSGNPKSVLYFTASWCGPCRAIKPIYEQMSEKYENVAFGKVDVDDNPEAAAEFQIAAVPTFCFFDGTGKGPANRFSGADPNQLDRLAKELNDK